MKINPYQAADLGGCLPCQSAASSKVRGQASPLPAVVTVDPKKADWIGIELKNQNGEPVPEEPFVIELAGGGKVTGKLDTLGKIRIEGIDPGNCRVTFPDRDAKEWKKR